MNLLTLVQALAWTHRELRQRAARAVMFSMVVRNWLFGFYIVEFEQRGEDRAEYGSKLLEGLAERLAREGLPGMSVTNLKNFRRFYESTPSIRQTVSAELATWDPQAGLADALTNLPEPLLHLLSRQFRLGWSHYLVLLGIKDPVERRFYEIEAAADGWTVRELERQMNSGLFERLALSRDHEQVYIHYFDRFRKHGDENPTIGILLCKRKNDALVELALPADSNVFASLYQLYLSSKEELRRQMEDVVREIEVRYGEVG